MLRALSIASVLSLGAAALAFAARPLLQPAQGMPEVTEEHRLLQSGVGTWEGTLTMYMPGVPEDAVQATEAIEAIGDYWTSSRFECELMGMPFLGTGVVGYNARQKKFVGTWIDNMTSELAVMEGQLDPKTKALVMHWEATDPVTGKLVPHRVETLHEGDSYTSTFYFGADQGVKSMVIVMKRKGAK